MPSLPSKRDYNERIGTSIALQILYSTSSLFDDLSTDSHSNKYEEEVITSAKEEDTSTIFSEDAYDTILSPFDEEAITILSPLDEEDGYDTILPPFDDDEDREYLNEKNKKKNRLNSRAKAAAKRRYPDTILPPLDEEDAYDTILPPFDDGEDEKYLNKKNKKKNRLDSRAKTAARRRPKLSTKNEFYTKNDDFSIVSELTMMKLESPSTATTKEESMNNNSRMEHHQNDDNDIEKNYTSDDETSSSIIENEEGEEEFSCKIPQELQIQLNTNFTDFWNWIQESPWIKRMFVSFVLFFIVSIIFLVSSAIFFNS